MRVPEHAQVMINREGLNSCYRWCCFTPKDPENISNSHIAIPQTEKAKRVVHHFKFCTVFSRDYQDLKLSLMHLRILFLVYLLTKRQETRHCSLLGSLPPLLRNSSSKSMYKKSTSNRSTHKESL